MVLTLLIYRVLLCFCFASHVQSIKLVHVSASAFVYVLHIFQKVVRILVTVKEHLAEKKHKQQGNTGEFEEGHGENGQLK